MRIDASWMGPLMLVATAACGPAASTPDAALLADASTSDASTADASTTDASTVDLDAPLDGGNAAVTATLSYGGVPQADALVVFQDIATGDVLDSILNDASGAATFVTSVPVMLTAVIDDPHAGARILYTFVDVRPGESVRYDPEPNDRPGPPPKHDLTLVLPAAPPSGTFDVLVPSTNDCPETVITDLTMPTVVSTCERAGHVQAIAIARDSAGRPLAYAMSLDLSPSTTSVTLTSWLGDLAHVPLDVELPADFGVTTSITGHRTVGTASVLGSVAGPRARSTYRSPSPRRGDPTSSRRDASVGRARTPPCRSPRRLSRRLSPSTRRRTSRRP